MDDQRPLCLLKVGSPNIGILRSEGTTTDDGDHHVGVSSFGHQSTGHPLTVECLFNLGIRFDPGQIHNHLL